MQSLGMDEYGLLREPRAWTPSLAREIAEHDGLGELTDDHWVMIRALRDYYDEYQTAPPISHMCVESGLKKSCGHELFQTCMVAWRVAGLPDPGEEARAYLSSGL